MGKFEKQLEKMRNNPQGWRIEDLMAIANRFDILWRQNGTSHVVFKFKDGAFPVPAKRPIKPIYVMEFLKRVEATNNED